jgi:hypothetical protein
VPEGRHGFSGILVEEIGFLGDADAADDGS